MTRLAKQLSIYQSYHSKLITRITHFIGVPVTIFALMILLNWVEVGIHTLGTLQLSWILIIAVSIYYLILDWILALITIAIVCGITYLALYFAGPYPNLKGMWIFIVSFLIGLGFQFLGHLFEGKRPALVDDMWQIFIAPMFLVTEVACRFGYKPELKDYSKDST